MRRAFVMFGIVVSEVGIPIEREKQSQFNAYLI